MVSSFCTSALKWEGGIAFQKAHSREIWDYCSMNPEFNKIFNDAMGCTAKITMKAIMTEYKDGFCGVGSMVDVGGGTEAVMGEIVKVHPHIKGTNFDLPHVTTTAPEHGEVAAASSANKSVISVYPFHRVQNI
ncbi:unnamed protein product [Camellia sinensis]